MRGLCLFFLSILTRESLQVVSNVFGLIGHNVTLPCGYDTKSYGVLSFCWGQGTLPLSKCSDPVLSSEDGAVRMRKSSRYQLLGRLADGDVSLTILNAQWSDIGVYSCRVEIPGWFNDHKASIKLMLKEAEEPVIHDCSPDTTGTPETWTTPAELSDPTLTVLRSITPESEFKDLLGVEGIARMGAIFFLTIVIILIFIFRKRFQRRGAIEHLYTSAPENIYESVPTA
ncbi:hypothetical protein INR49_024340 [Caranx melampygus]|nr:hypothetical protein INR49_024340 [Caranx melampygus]